MNSSFLWWEEASAQSPWWTCENSWCTPSLCWRRSWIQSRSPGIYSIHILGCLRYSQGSNQCQSSHPLWGLVEWASCGVGWWSVQCKWWWKGCSKQVIVSKSPFLFSLFAICSLVCYAIFDSETDDFVVVFTISNLEAHPSSCHVFLIVQHQSLTLTAFCCQYPGLAALLHLLFICLVLRSLSIYSSEMFIRRSKCQSTLMPKIILFGQKLSKILSK